MTESQITKADLLGLLERSDEPLASKVKLILASADSASYRLGQQPADRTRRTFELKYGMAKERGVAVHGLRDLLEDLSLLGAVEVLACVVQGETAFGLVVLDLNLSGVVGILYVALPPPSLCVS